VYAVLGDLSAGTAGGHLAWRKSAGSTPTPTHPAAETGEQNTGSAVPYETTAR